MHICMHRNACICLNSQKDIYTKLHSETLICFGFRIAVAREAQQVAMEHELLESLPLLYKNQPEQVTMALECTGKGGQPCQGPANVTVTVRQRKLHNSDILVHFIMILP